MYQYKQIELKKYTIYLSLNLKSKELGNVLTTIINIKKIYILHLRDSQL